MEERRNEASEPKQTLFSWAELMAGAPEPPKRQRQHEAPTRSLFEWALEREREAELVGAGR